MFGEEPCSPSSLSTLFPGHHRCIAYILSVPVSDSHEKSSSDSHSKISLIMVDLNQGPCIEGWGRVG